MFKNILKICLIVIIIILIFKITLVFIRKFENRIFKGGANPEHVSDDVSDDVKTIMRLSILTTFDNSDSIQNISKYDTRDDIELINNMIVSNKDKNSLKLFTTIILHYPHFIMKHHAIFKPFFEKQFKRWRVLLSLLTSEELVQVCFEWWLMENTGFNSNSYDYIISLLKKYDTQLYYYDLNLTEFIRRILKLRESKRWDFGTYVLEKLKTDKSLKFRIGRPSTGKIIECICYFNNIHMSILENELLNIVKFNYNDVLLDNIYEIFKKWLFNTKSTPSLENQSEVLLDVENKLFDENTVKQLLDRYANHFNSLKPGVDEKVFFIFPEMCIDNTYIKSICKLNDSDDFDTKFKNDKTELSSCIMDMMYVDKIYKNLESCKESDNLYICDNLDCILVFNHTIEKMDNPDNWDTIKQDVTKSLSKVMDLFSKSEKYSEFLENRLSNNESLLSQVKIKEPYIELIKTRSLEQLSNYFMKVFKILPVYLKNYKSYNSFKELQLNSVMVSIVYFNPYLDERSEYDYHKHRFESTIPGLAYLSALLIVTEQCALPEFLSNPSFLMNLSIKRCVSSAFLEYSIENDLNDEYDESAFVEFLNMYIYSGLIKDTYDSKKRCYTNNIIRKDKYKDVIFPLSRALSDLFGD